MKYIAEGYVREVKIENKSTDVELTIEPTQNYAVDIGTAEKKDPRTVLVPNELTMGDAKLVSPDRLFQLKPRSISTEMLISLKQNRLKVRVMLEPDGADFRVDALEIL